MGFLGIEPTEPKVTPADIFYGDLAPHAEQGADSMVAFYREGLKRWFHRENFTVADLQAVADADQESTVKIFAASRDLAALIYKHYPGVLQPSELQSKVPYDAEILASEGRIVFDPEAPYPGPEAV